jgi:hypothetical protein
MAKTPIISKVTTDWKAFPAPGEVVVEETVVEETVVEETVVEETPAEESVSE